MHQTSSHAVPASRSKTTPKADKPNPAQRDKPSSFALERLHAGVTELLDSAAWREALKFKAKFHRYSFNNSVLIFLQRPDATLVAGYRR